MNEGIRCNLPVVFARYPGEAATPTRIQVDRAKEARWAIVRSTDCQGDILAHDRDAISCGHYYANDSDASSPSLLIVVAEALAGNLLLLPWPDRLTPAWINNGTKPNLSKSGQTNMENTGPSKCTRLTDSIRRAIASANQDSSTRLVESARCTTSCISLRRRDSPSIPRDAPSHGVRHCTPGLMHGETHSRDTTLRELAGHHAHDLIPRLVMSTSLHAFELTKPAKRALRAISLSS